MEFSLPSVGRVWIFSCTAQFKKNVTGICGKDSRSSLYFNEGKRFLQLKKESLFTSYLAVELSSKSYDVSTL